MSDDGWDDDYADDGGYDDGSFDDYSDDENGGGGGGGGGYGEKDVGTTEYVDEVEVETPGYAEVEEANDNHYRDAEGDDESGDDDHPDYNGSSNSSQADENHNDNDGNNERGASMSNYEYMKPWGGTHGFMRSYGITRSPEGYEEARDLIDTMREMAEKHENLE